MKRIIIGALLISFSAEIASAQQPSTLTFKEAVKIGLQNNVLLKQQKNQLSYSQVNKTSSLLQLGPSVQINGSGYVADGNSFNQQEGRVINGVVDFVNGSIDANMPIFNGLAIVNSYRQASRQNEAQLHLVNRSSQDVIRDVANQYLNCLLDQQLIKIDESNLENQKSIHNQINEQVEVGSKAEADLYNQQYQVKNAELLLLRSRNKLKNDKAILAQTLQLDPIVSFEIEEVQWDINTLFADSISLDQMERVALQRRSDLLQAEHLEKAARYGYHSQKGKFYPSFNAGISYGSRYNNVHGEQNRSFTDQFLKDNTQLSYGVSMVIPLYNGFQTKAQIALSKVTYDNAKITKASTQVNVKTDVIRSFQNYTDSKTSVEVSFSQLRSAELAYNTEKERYDLGISTIVQLTTINKDYVKAQSDYQNALFTLMFQRLLLNHTTGTLRFEDIP